MTDLLSILTGVPKRKIARKLQSEMERWREREEEEERDREREERKMDRRPKLVINIVFFGNV